MTHQEILEKAQKVLKDLTFHSIDVIDIKKPTNITYARQLIKVVSKLSPLIGNMIELLIVDTLNKYNYENCGEWIRQDPGFPDVLFKSKTVFPNPGIEIKAWLPLATEITARFKDSVTAFSQNNIDVALVAWLPEYVIWGKPQIIDVLVISGKSVAEARDLHYHKPPEYLIFEPEDTSNRTINLQQSNTNGYKLQLDKCNIADAIAVVESWGPNSKNYNSSPAYQQLLKSLQSQFVYRLDTNYAKIDRIEHNEIEAFKARVLDTQFHGKTIKQWGTILSSNNNDTLKKELTSIL